MFICVLGTGAHGPVGMGAADITSVRRGWECPMTNTVCPKQRLSFDLERSLWRQGSRSRQFPAADIHTAAPGRHVSKKL